MNKNTKSNQTIRYVLGGYFIVVGLISMWILNFVTGALFVATGVTFLPIIYKNFNSKYKKYIQIIIPGVLYNIAVAAAVITAIIKIAGSAEIDRAPIAEPEAITSEENFEEDGPDEEGTEITGLHLSESAVEMEINSSKEVILEVFPENFEVQDLELCSSNDDVAFLEISETQNEIGKLKLQLKSESEGECEVFVKAINDIESNKMYVKTVDNQKYTEESNQEEKPVKQTENESPKNEAPKTNPEKSQTKTNDNTQSNKSQQNGSSKPNKNNTHGEHIYCTPKGKRYHYDPDCGGKNSKETTWAEVKARGLTPCKKCAK